jgi:hypothetical protein
VTTVGATVNIAAGTYNESVTFVNSGTTGEPITFVAVGDVIIKGNLTITGSYIVVDGITDSPPTAGGYNAITVGGQHNVLKNSKVTNYGTCAGDQATAIGVGGAYNLIENNTIRDMNDIDAFHIFGHDQTIRVNYVTNIDQIYYSTPQPTPCYGTNHSDFIQTWGLNGMTSYNILVENNLVTNSTMQIGCISNDDNVNVHDWTFRNNIISNIGNAFFVGVPYTSFYNNIFINNQTSQGYVVALYDIPGGYSSVGDKFFNNVFINNGTDIQFHDAAAYHDLTDYPDNTSNNYFAGANYTAKTNEEYMGTNYVNGGDPKFTNATSLDFTLTSASTILIDKGTTISPTFSDRNDVSRPQGTAWDIGAYEYTSTIAPTHVAPTISLSVSPTSTTSPATITLTATASADTGSSISQVEFYNGSTLLTTDSSSPYTYTWSGVSVGTYALTAKASDNLGSSATSSAQTVTVSAPIINMEENTTSTNSGSPSGGGGGRSRTRTVCTLPQVLNTTTNTCVTPSSVSCSPGQMFRPTDGARCTTWINASGSSYNFGNATLKNGSKGEAVKELQRFLNAKLNLGLVIDGKLGPKTIAVVKKWQLDNGLVADGLIGAKTKAKMNASG